MMKQVLQKLMNRSVIAVLVMMSFCLSLSAQFKEFMYSPALLTKAQNGDAEAQYKLACCYDRGKSTGVALDRAKAAKWYKAAALKGHVDAMYRYAGVLLKGKYMPADTASYKKYILRAAEKGHDGAISSVALAYRYGFDGFEKDSVKAAGYYVKLHDVIKPKADAGEPFDMENLAYLYKDVECFKSEAHKAKGLYEEALNIYRKRAEAGDVYSANLLAWKYCYGIKDVLEPDTLQALKYYEMAAQSDQDSPNGLESLAIIYFKRGDFAKAVYYARKAMDHPLNELSYGASLLGQCYYKGLGVDKNIAEAVRCFQKVVGNKEAYDYDNWAHVGLANCYYYGMGVKTDYAQFVRLLDGISLWNNPEMKYLLAKCYFDGKGVKKNMAKVLEIIRYFNCNDDTLKMKAARLYFDGAYAEAQRYQTGKGVKRDLEKAADMFDNIKDHVNGDKKLTEKADIARDECRLALADSLLKLTSGNVMENKKKAAYLFFRLGVNGSTDQIKGEGYYRYAICGIDYNGNEVKGFDTYYLEKAAKLKYPAALYLLGICHVSGFGVEKDEMKAADLFRQTVATGDIDASNGVANFYMDHKMYSEARPIYEANGKKGSAEAYYRLGQMYDNPELWQMAPDRLENIITADAVIEYYTKAAEMSYADAQYRLSFIYGIGALEELYPVNYEPDKARMWLTKAAKQGHIDAMAMLGDCYYSGALSTTINYREALKWLKPAAEQGDDGALYDLGCMYEKGLGGLRKDTVKAISLFQQAARKDNDLAKDKLRAKGLTW